MKVVDSVFLLKILLMDYIWSTREEKIKIFNLSSGKNGSYHLSDGKN